jgi:hypothetical protein
MGLPARTRQAGNGMTRESVDGEGVGSSQTRPIADQNSSQAIADKGK